MKLTLVVLTTLAAGVLAAPAPEAEPWCYRPGQGCWKAKRTAEAEPWCYRPGQGCWKVKRVAEAFTDAVQSAGGLATRALPDDAAFAAQQALEELAQIIALTEDDPEAFFAGLGEDKTDAKEKREAVAEADNDKRWCYRPGQGCWKAKRAAEAVAEALSGEIAVDGFAKRDAEPSAEENARRWCYRPGQGCWKAKRDLSAIGVMARDVMAAL
jgi:hypothetical protein